MQSLMEDEFGDQIAEIKQQRDELMAAIVARLAADDQIESAATDIDLIAARRTGDEANDLMRTAIAKAKGGQP